jgi:hypothetical protein
MRVQSVCTNVCECACSHIWANHCPSCPPEFFDGDCQVETVK